MVIGASFAINMLAGFLLMFCACDLWGHGYDSIAYMVGTIGFFASSFGCVGIWAINE